MQVMPVTRAAMKRWLMRKATQPVPAAVAPPTVVVNVQLPDMVGDLLRQIGDGRGGIRTSDRITQLPG